MGTADGDDGHLKRIACQICTQLPDDKGEALKVLRYVRQIVFCLGEEWETDRRETPILPFGRALKGRADLQATLRVIRSDLPDTTNQG